MNDSNTSNRILYTEIKERLRDQLDSVDTLDTKSGITIAFVGALIGGLANSSWFIGLHYYFMLPIMIALTLTTLFALISILSREYRKDPEPSELVNKYKDKTEIETKAQLIRNFEDCFNANESIISFKKKMLNIAFTLLFVSIILLCITMFLSTNSLFIEKIAYEGGFDNV